MSSYVHCSYVRALSRAGLILGTLFFGASTGPVSSFQPTLPPPKARIVENYGRLPIRFESNTGQADKRVKFLSRGSRYRLELASNEAVLEVQESEVKSQKSEKKPPRPLGWGPSVLTASRGSKTPTASEGAAVLRMKLVGANAQALVTGRTELPGKFNYFIGNDPKKWRTGVPTYARVRYSGIYPGIDLVYHGNQRQLEFDFAVAPHADPKRIRLWFGPSAGLHLAGDNDLRVTIANTAVVFRKPLVYQMVNGRRRPAVGNFAWGTIRWDSAWEATTAPTCW